MRLESQLSRMNCQMFSTGLSLGHLAGSGMMLILSGMISASVICHRAWSMSSTAWAPSATVRAISARCRFLASVLQNGRTSPAPFPSAGQIAPQMSVDVVR